MRHGVRPDQARRTCRNAPVSPPAPRLELRAFGRGLGLVEARIRRRAPCEAITESREVYILGTPGLSRNVKVRRGRLELKTLLAHEGDLQRWRPAGQWSFPLGGGLPGEVALAAAGQAPPAGDPLSLGDLMAWVAATPGLVRANVFKRRFRFTLGGCAVELDHLAVNGAAIESVAVEAKDGDAVEAARRELGLADCENVSFPLALARICGLQPLPEERDYEHGD